MTLSGFIFQAICRNRQIIYFEFLRNRILRIAPLFLVWTLFLFYTGDTDPSKLFVAILSLLNRDAVPGAGWTIIVEVQFYVIFPFLLVFTRKYGIRYLVGHCCWQSSFAQACGTRREQSRASPTGRFLVALINSFLA